MTGAGGHTRPRGSEVDGDGHRRFRAAVDRIREARSWNEASKALGSSSQGFAQAAYRAKHMVRWTHVKAAEEAVEELISLGEIPATPPSQNGAHPPALKGKATPEAEALVNAFDELRHNFQGALANIAEALGGQAPQGAYYKIKKGEQFDVAPDTLQSVLQLVKRCRRGEVPWMERPGRKGPKPAAEKPPVAEAAPTPAKPAPEAPAPSRRAPGTMEEVQSALLEIGLELDERLSVIVDGLESMMAVAPRFQRASFEAQIEKMKKTSEVVNELLRDFE